MILVLKMLCTFVYDRKNENHWSLLIIRYSLLITRNTNTLVSVFLTTVLFVRYFSLEISFRALSKEKLHNIKFV